MSEGFDAPGLLAPAELGPGYRSAPNIAVLRLATAAYGTGPEETPADTWWQPGIIEEIELSQSAFDALAVGGRTALTLGDVLVSDHGRMLGDAARYSTADGRPAALRVVPVLSAMASNYGTPIGLARGAWRGVVRSMTEDTGGQIRIALSDLSERLAEPLQASVYDGAGGLGGGPELKGLPRPVALGQVYNLRPVSLGNVDLGAGALPTYQSSWRAIVAHDVVRIRGVEQVATGGTPGVGQFRDFPAQGCFQLGSSADGEVTADLRGDVGSLYVNSTAGIVRRLVTALGPQIPDGDLDPLAFSFADEDMPGIVGWWQGAEPTTALAAVEAILAACGGMLAGGRDGRLRLADPLGSVSTVQMDLPDAWILECEPLPMPVSLRPPPRQVEVGWRRNWFPLSGVAGIVPEADRQRLQQPGSTASAASAEVTARVAQQRVLRLPGLYWEEAAALARAERWRDWIAGAPRAFRVVTDRYLDQVEIGHTARITYPRYGLQGGLTGVVLAWRERLGARRLEFTIVGVPD